MGRQGKARGKGGGGPDLFHYFADIICVHYNYFCVYDITFSKYFFHFFTAIM